MILFRKITIWGQKWSLFEGIVFYLNNYDMKRSWKQRQIFTIYGTFQALSIGNLKTIKKRVLPVQKLRKSFSFIEMSWGTSATKIGEILKSAHL